MLHDALDFARAIWRFGGRRGVRAVALVAGGAVVEGFSVVMLVPLLGTLIGGTTTGSPVTGWFERWLPAIDPMQRLGLLLTLFGAVMVVRTVILWQRDVMLGELQVSFVEAHRASLARRLAEARWPALARIGHDRVTYAMGGDIQRCGAGVSFLCQSIVAAAMLAAQAGIAVLLAPGLTIVAMAVMAAGALLLSGMVRQSHDIGLLVTRANLTQTAAIGRFLAGMKMAKGQNLQGAFVSAFEAELNQGAGWQIAFLGKQGLVRGLWSLLAALVAATTLLLGVGVFHLPVPILLALLLLFARISGPAAQIHNGLQQIAYSLPAWRAIESLDRELAAEAEPAPAMAGAPFPPGSVVFANVTYRHTASGGGVDRLSLQIDDGAMIGIAGESGAGKSTFADLLTGLLVPQFGEVRIGGVPVDEKSAPLWRRQLAYVAQDPVLFNRTVRDNLLWARPAATDADLAAAIAIAGAERMISRLPHGIGSVVGEGGSLISGGERQRLALARAVLRLPRLLILDEATSAIDLTGEYEILVRLRAMIPRPTIVLIAHRRESLALCDRVFTFANGRLVSQPPVSNRRDVLGFTG